MAEYTYCWRCDMHLPMLDDREWDEIGAALTQSVQAVKQLRQATGLPVVPALAARPGFAEALNLYRRITGFRETNINAIWHHQRSRYGPPCVNCARPLRTAQASFCPACGHVRDRCASAEAAEQAVMARIMAEQAHVWAHVYGASRHQVLAWLSRELGPMALSDEFGELWRYEGDAAHVWLRVDRDGESEALQVDVHRAGQWPSSLRFARFLSQALDVRVRCDPGADFPEIDRRSSIFLEIDQGQERWIDWAIVADKKTI